MNNLFFVKKRFRMLFSYEQHIKKQGVNLACLLISSFCVVMVHAHPYTPLAAGEVFQSSLSVISRPESAMMAFSSPTLHAKGPTRINRTSEQYGLVGNSEVEARDEQKDIPLRFLTNQIVFQVLSAELALQRGQAAAAYQTYLALLRETLDPRMAQRATEIALRAGSPADALIAAQLWAENAPHSRRAFQVEGILFILNGQLDKAEPLIAKELANTPAHQRAATILSLQSFLARTPDPLKGLQLLQAVLKNDSDLPEAQFALARQYLAANQPELAYQALKKTLALKPSLTEAALLLGQLGPTQRAEAITLLKDFVKNHPRQASALLVLAQLYITDNQLDAAKKVFQTYAKKHPDNLTPLLAMALIEMQQKHYSRAEHLLQRYIHAGRESLDINTNTNIGQAYLYLAQIAVEKKNYALAQYYLSKVRPSNPRYFAARIALAEVLAKMGKLDSAQGILLRLSSSTLAEQALIALTNSSILFEAQQYMQAEAELAKANQRFPNEPTLLYYYAMAAEKNGRYALMESLLKRVIQLQPDNPNAYNALGFSLADRNQRLNEAYECIQRATELAPNDPYIMDSLGWVHYRQGHTKQAVKILKRAYHLQPHADIAAHLGEVLWAQGSRNAAKQVWQAAKKQDPHNDLLQKVMQRFLGKKS